MKFYHVALILLLQQLSHSECFAPNTVNTFLSCQQVQNSRLFQSAPDDSWDSNDAGSNWFTDSTKHILNRDIVPGTLSAATMEEIFPLMLWWADQAYKRDDAAHTVEDLLNRLEAELNTGADAPKPAIKYYTLAVKAWSQAGFPEKAEDMITRMEELSLTSRVSYNHVMNAYAKQGNMKRVTEIIEMMEERPEISPTVNDYNVLLSGYARTGQARSAEALVKRMVGFCEERENEDLAPDLYTYNSLLDAWSKSDDPGRGVRAQEILSTLIEKNKKGEFDWSPDERSFSLAISAVAKTDVDPKEIESLWNQALDRGYGSDPYIHTALLDAYASFGCYEKATEVLEKLEQKELASHVAFNTVLKALKEDGSEKALKKAEALLQRMISLGTADVFSYSTLIAMHADKGNTESAERAEELLLDMSHIHLQPTVYALNAVMNAWTRCQKIPRAERILQEMEDSYYNQNVGERIIPNVVSYTTVCNGWAKCGDIEKTKETFERMKAMYKSGNVEARPNLFSYITLINAIARSPDRGSAAQAEQVLYQMYDEYKSGFIETPPNARLVTTVIDSWQKSGERDAGERAEDILDWLLRVYKAEGDPTLQPDEYTFNSVIAAWARSRKFGKAARARAILTRMNELNKDGTISASPNAYCYTTVINGCAFCEKDTIEQKQALQIAIETYKEMLGNSAEGPNQITYATLATAFRNLMPPGETRTLALEAIFKKCSEGGLVSKLFLDRLQSSLNTKELRSILGDDVVLDNGTIAMSRVPSEWIRRSSDKAPKEQAAQVGS